MSLGGSVAVWSSWAFHADALADVLAHAGERVVVVGDPGATAGLLVVDVASPGVVELLRSRGRAGWETVVWGGTLSARWILDLRAAGASAYVSALALPHDLADVVRQVRDGGRVAWPAPSVSAALTPREREVALAYLVTGAGRSRAQVAAQLGISERTVKVHVARIRDKAGHEGTATREGLRHELTIRGWIPGA